LVLSGPSITTGAIMAGSGTETASERYRGIDLWASADVLTEIAAAQRQAVDAVALSVPALARAGEAIADRLRAGGRLVYAGAGSSGLLAQVDALELPGTYGIPAASVPVLMAGGPAAFHEIPVDAEDDEAAAEEAVDHLAVGSGDCLLAVAASGRTPFSLAALRRAHGRGALTVGIASNPDTPILLESDHPVLLATPPEVIAGSTRMNAGTAQKCALNMLSTLIGIRLGHVYDGLMVNLSPANAKLRLRAVAIVTAATGVDRPRAAELLERAGEIKAAILLEGGAADPEEARDILKRHGGDVRASLAFLSARRKKAG
jgi:N-acetylmuramic acid 6-phosphate etherase